MNESKMHVECNLQDVLYHVNYGLHDSQNCHNRHHCQLPVTSQIINIAII